MLLSRRNKLKLISVLICFLLLISNYLFPPAAHAFTSLNACANNIVCAKGLITETAVRQTVRSTTLNAVQKTVTVSGGITKSQIINAVGVTLGFVAGGGLSYSYYSESDIESLRETAKSRFCANNDAPLQCDPRVKLTYYSLNSQSERVDFAHSYSIDSTVCGNSLNGVRLYRDDSPAWACILEDTLEIEDLPPPEWEDAIWGGEFEETEKSPREIAVELLVDSELIDALSTDQMVSPGEAETAEQSIILNSDISVGGTESSPEIVPGGVTLIPEPNIETNTETETGETGTNTGTNTGAGTGTESETGDSVTGTGTNTGTGTEETDELDSEPPPLPELEVELEPEPEPDVDLVVPGIEALEPVEFDAPNFVEYAISKFSDKFPFDILGDFDAEAISNDCPSYIFFARSFELCPIRDFLVAFKVPIIIGFMWRVYHTL